MHNLSGVFMFMYSIFLLLVYAIAPASLAGVVVANQSEVAPIVATSPIADNLLLTKLLRHIESEMKLIIQDNDTLDDDDYRQEVIKIINVAQKAQVLMTEIVIALTQPQGGNAVHSPWDGSLVWYKFSVMCNVLGKYGFATKPLSELKPRHIRRQQEALATFALALHKSGGKQPWMGTMIKLINALKTCLACDDYLTSSITDIATDWGYYQPREWAVKNPRMAVALAAVAAAGIAYIAYTKYYAQIQIPAPTSLSELRRASQQPSLENLGNTCYANAVLQSLSRMPKQNIDMLCGAPEGSLPRELGDVLHKLANNTAPGEVIIPKKLHDAFVKMHTREIMGKTTVGLAINAQGKVTLDIQPTVEEDSQFKLGRQHDADEYLRALINDVREHEYFKNCGRDPFPFTLKQSTTVTCLPGGHASTRNESGDSLQIEVRADTTKNVLADCIKSYGEAELLEGVDAYDCSGAGRCGQKVRALKKIEISQAPNLLVLQAKIFTFNKATLNSDKAKTAIPFPLKNLELPIKNHGPEKYKLSAVVGHSGPTLGNGHYTALINKNDQWVFCNDSCTSVVADDVIQKIADAGMIGASASGAFTPYLLFYQKTS